MSEGRCIHESGGFYALYGADGRRQSWWRRPKSSTPKRYVESLNTFGPVDYIYDSTVRAEGATDFDGWPEYDTAPLPKARIRAKSKDLL